MHLLAATYVFVAEIARRCETHPRGVPTWLRSKGVHPDIALQQNRDFGYLRLAVEPLLDGFASDVMQAKASLHAADETIRTRFIKAVAAGAALGVTAKAMDVPYRKAERWLHVWRKTGAFAERKLGVRSKLDGHEDFLRELVASRPTIKLAEIQDAIASRGVKTSQTPVWNALKRFGIALADRTARQAADVQNLTSQSRSEERNST